MRGGASPSLLLLGLKKGRGADALGLCQNDAKGHGKGHGPSPSEGPRYRRHTPLAGNADVKYGPLHSGGHFAFGHFPGGRSCAAPLSCFAVKLA